MPQLFTLFFLLCTHSVLLAQQVTYHETEIKADGLLNEAVWAEIRPFQHFHNFFPINEGAARFDTEVRIFQDGKFLNIAFVYHDSLAAIRVNSRKRDNYAAGFHLSDCVGVIIDPYNNQNRGYFFALNGAGTQLDALVANYDEDNLSWDALWESGQSVQGTDKVYEFKIPLSTFSYDEEIENWSFQFYTRDAKDRQYTVWNKFERGFLQFDTRFLKPVAMEQLQPVRQTRTLLLPSLTASYQEDLIEATASPVVQPSLDVQYKVSDGLRIDVTLNPDFSQVDVDQQVTNLTRFNIVFPERRNFFIENSDMFTTLGLSDDITPFYSRFVGAEEALLLGLKLSGNVAPNTRVGLLSVQSKKGDLGKAQNYTVASVKQQFGPVFNATAYLVNRQETEGWTIQDDYNRVIGLKANYLSKNRKWSGLAGYSRSFSDQIAGDQHAFSIQNNYNTRTWSFSTRVSQVGSNYFTDIGFVPRLENYDALSAQVYRAGYIGFSQRLSYNFYPDNQEQIQSFRPLNAELNVYLDEDGAVYESNLFYNIALFFANQMSLYINTYHDAIQLKYAFDPLRNGALILPAHYRNTAVRLGYNSDYTRQVYGSVNVQYGSFFEGQRSRFGAVAGFRLLPLFNLELNYEYNALDIGTLGQADLHLLGLTTELFFSNKLNWTTYLQYNKQIDNFNINSRLQWEYKPLSFVYLVFSDNYNQLLDRKNWAVSLKVNRRLNF